MRILLTNDDGILSPVLERCAIALHSEHEVVVVAPSTDQSGKSHSFTHGPDKLLRFKQDSEDPFTLVQVEGTPSDCVKFGLCHLFKQRKIELVISGINLGENAGVSTVYSGTVAGAREAALWNIPAIALSIWKHTDRHLEFALTWLLAALRQPMLLPKPGEYFNVNFPACEPSEVTGVEVTTMSDVMFTDGYTPLVDAHGITGYRLDGYKPKELFKPGTDDYALLQGRVAVTPLRITQSNAEAALRLQVQQTRLHLLMQEIKSP